MSRPFFGWFRSPRRAPARRKCSLIVETLEDRLTPSNYQVDKLGDIDDGNTAAGEVTLREAIRLANADVADDVIFFAATLSNSTITMTGPTYSLSTPMVISAVFGTTQAPGIVIDGGNARTIFQIDDGNNSNAMEVTLNGLTMTKGASASVGGAIRVGADNLNIFNSTVSNSIALFGGGISLQGTGAGIGRLVIGNSTISGNTATVAGGGILASGGRVQLFSDTISGNIAGDTAGGNGGGVRVQDEAQFVSVNCTFVDNRAKQVSGAGEGGGVSSANSAAARPTFANSIIAGNLVINGGVAGPNDIAGLLFNDSAFNLVGDAATSGGLANNLSNNIVGNNGAGVLPIGTVVYPRLTKNGGSTATHALVPNSPAINRGNNARATDHLNRAITLDQRGQTFVRIFGGVVDIGAVEMQASEAFSFFDVTVGTTPEGASPIATATAFAAFSQATNLAPDLAIADAASNTVGIYLKSGANSYATTAAIALALPANANPSSLLVADFNGDSLPDLAVANAGLSGAASVSVFLNTTTVAGTPTFAARLDLDGPNNPIALAAANIDGDATNRLDIVVLSGAVNLAGDYTFTVFVGDGLGTFASGSVFKVGDNTPSGAELVGPTSLAVGDLVGDANPDIVIAALNGSTYLTNVSAAGAPNFTLAPARFVNTNNTAIAVGKANGDALNDIFYVTGAFPGVNGGVLVIFHNNGGGSFSGTSYAVYPNPVALTLADINTDGRTDILVANSSPDTLSLLLNTTTGPLTTLTSPIAFHLGGTVRGIAVGDVDQNGIPDLAIANGAAGTDLFIGNNGFTAHSFVVDTLADIADGKFSPGNLSLREAIVLANLNPGRDTISFASALTAAGLATLLLDSDLPAITDDLALAGPGDTFLALSGQNARRILTVDDGNNAQDIAVSISGLRFQNGSADGGGAILSRENLTLSKSTFANNQSGPTLNGGAISAVNAGSLTVSDSAFLSNSASAASGGAICSDRPTTISASTFTSNSALNGGAIANNGATMTISSSTLSGNTADPINGFGGAIRVAVGTVNVVNSTISGNIAGSGGGVAVFFASTAVLTSSTVVGNRASNGGGIVAFGIASLFNTIVAGNTFPVSTNPSDIALTVVATSSNNLIGDAATSGGIIHNTNGNIVGNAGAGTLPLSSILSATLAANGGPTLTHALVQNSLAIGGGSETVAGFIRYDQREAGRDVGDPDIGAFEVQHPLAPVGVPVNDAKLFSPQPSPNANTAFIKGMYHATLLRDAESSGLDFWLGQLAAGVSRETVALGFINSFENRANQVTFFYRYFLKRDSEPVGLNFHVARLQSGVDEATVMTGFVLSPEFAGQNNNTSFVNLMYYAVLGRQAEASGFNSWKFQLDSGTLSREQVVNGFLRSGEGIGRVVQSYFQSYLKHPADPSGSGFFTNLIVAGNTFGSVAAKILASDDFYFNRAIPNRS